MTPTLPITARPRPDSIDDKVYFKYLYLPFVLLEVIWDYADTLCNMSAQLRIPELKGVSRAIRTLRKEYEYYRKRLSAKYRDREEKSMIFFQTIFGKELEAEYRLMHWQVQHVSKDLAPDYLDLVATAQLVRAFSSATIRYCNTADRELEKIWGKAPRTIISPVAKAMMNLLGHFAGEEYPTVSDTDIQASAKRLYDYFMQTKCEGKFQETLHHIKPTN